MENGGGGEDLELEVDKDPFPLVWTNWVRTFFNQVSGALIGTKRVHENELPKCASAHV